MSTKEKKLIMVRKITVGVKILLQMKILFEWGNLIEK